MTARSDIDVRDAAPLDLDSAGDVAAAARAGLLPVGAGRELAIRVPSGLVPRRLIASRSAVQCAPRSCTVHAPASATWAEAEAAALGEGLTLGGIVDACADATIGGTLGRRAWLPALWPCHTARGAVLALEAVTRTGRRYVASGAPRTSSGPDLRAVFFGAEGRAGAILSVSLQAAPADDELLWLRIDRSKAATVQRTLNRHGAIAAARGEGGDLVVRLRTGSRAADVAASALVAASARETAAPAPLRSRPRVVVTTPWDRLSDAFAAASDPSLLRILAAGPTHVALAIEPTTAAGRRGATAWAQSATTDPLARWCAAGIPVDAPETSPLAEAP
ncbi:MAG: FAD-binding oxidoreductase [Myxococcales bacterium]|nr:FAD-binding oxidoreductase [Myxococcales bacterium]MCB9531119.1 FAD-binding oxidoreductase [Myxococcales bacterium]MCB9533029.1 FAD-binding oxidoreductase [Myxococcales bacterium]